MLYKKISDTINHRTWDIEIEESHEFVLPKYYRDYPERKPFFNGDGMSRTKVRIREIIDLCYNNVVWNFVSQEDMLLVPKYIEQYLDEVNDLLDALPDDHPTVQFCKKAKLAVDKIRNVDSLVDAKYDQEHGSLGIDEDLESMLKGCII